MKSKQRITSWQPIETAPKDPYKLVLVKDDNSEPHFYIARYVGKGEDGKDYWDNACYHMIPTHWRLLGMQY